jgi:hypothetical protein
MTAISETLALTVSVVLFAVIPLITTEDVSVTETFRRSSPGVLDCTSTVLVTAAARASLAVTVIVPKDTDSVTEAESVSFADTFTVEKFLLSVTDALRVSLAAIGSVENTPWSLTVAVRMSLAVTATVEKVPTSRTDALNVSLTATGTNVVTVSVTLVNVLSKADTVNVPEKVRPGAPSVRLADKVSVAEKDAFGALVSVTAALSVSLVDTVIVPLTTMPLVSDNCVVRVSEPGVFAICRTVSVTAALSASEVANATGANAVASVTEAESVSLACTDTVANCTASVTEAESVSEAPFASVVITTAELSNTPRLFVSTAVTAVVENTPTSVTDADNVSLAGTRTGGKVPDSSVKVALKVSDAVTVAYVLTPSVTAAVSVSEADSVIRPLMTMPEVSVTKAVSASAAGAVANVAAKSVTAADSVSVVLVATGPNVPTSVTAAFTLSPAVRLALMVNVASVTAAVGVSLAAIG